MNAEIEYLKKLKELDSAKYGVASLVVYSDGGGYLRLGLREERKGKWELEFTGDNRRIILERYVNKVIKENKPKIPKHPLLGEYLGKSLLTKDIPDGLFLQYRDDVARVYQKVHGGVFFVTGVNRGAFVKYGPNSDTEFTVIDYEG